MPLLILPKEAQGDFFGVEASPPKCIAWKQSFNANLAGWKAFEQSLQDQIAKTRYLWWVGRFRLFLFLLSFWQLSFTIPWGEEEQGNGEGKEEKR